jgi:hypothetical protein
LSFSKRHAAVLTPNPTHLRSWYAALFCPVASITELKTGSDPLIWTDKSFMIIIIIWAKVEHQIIFMICYPILSLSIDKYHIFSPQDIHPLFLECCFSLWSTTGLNYSKMFSIETFTFKTIWGTITPSSKWLVQANIRLSNLQNS